MAILKMADLDLKGKRVLIRADLNVPLKDGKVASDKRIMATLPTIKLALEKGAKVMVISHLGRPEEGVYAEEFSLKPVADYIATKLDGVNVRLDNLGQDDLAVLFSEEPGAVIQVKTEDAETVMNILSGHGLASCIFEIGSLRDDDRIVFNRDGNDVINAPRKHFRKIWAETTYHMQSLRDNPDCARQEFEAKDESDDKGLFAELSFDISEDVAAPYISKGVAPKVAILREQGVNSHGEMAAAFNRAGFNCIDVHMSDVLSGRVKLNDFKGFAACGGFSYGDVLGAGEGWAKSILFNARARDEFYSTLLQRTSSQDSLTARIPSHQAYVTAVR